ncbi:hypothetical protein Bhyg_05260 [Pseudolycoriella hygida]|uniref:F-box domain-containing protein n=1 Tax=Pseudolycoriella hygida TaxID=35572 RepID=A0A9Q0S981_9DIPT|nr:hypothetical protein Bhyg_05260 [Pseudolycoriella hygida]
MKNLSEFMDLNDDCFLELFKYLSAEELIALKLTNKRLYHLTDYYFYSVYELKERAVILKGIDGCKLRNILVHCGKFIRNLVIDSPRGYSDMNDINDNCDQIESGTYIGELIGNYCSDKLHTLRLCSVYLSGFSSIPHGVLKNLKRMEMVRCCGNVDEILSHCQNITELIQRNCGFITKSEQHYLLVNDHTPLESLFIQNDYQSDLEPEILINFFHNKRNIKKFHYLNRVSPAPTFLLSAIVESINTIEELCIELDTFSQNFSSDLAALAQLDHLKRLEFNTDEIAVESFVNDLTMKNHLECFGASDICLSASLCNSMIRLTNLKVLKLIAPLRLFEEFFKIVSHHLVHLEEIYLVQCTDIFFGDLMSFVENLFKLRVLYLYENEYVNWNEDDGYSQFTIDFVQLFKIRSNMVTASPINILFDKNAMQRIEESIWPHEFEWCTKNSVLRLALADDEIVNQIPGFNPKQNDELSS